MKGKIETIATICLVLEIVLVAARGPVPVSLGCYQDDPRNSPLLSGPATSATEMTVQSCLAFCRSSDQRYAGLVNSFGCRCGNTFPGDAIARRRLPAPDCTAPCGGDYSQFCGGPSGSQKMEVFEASLGACGGDLNKDNGIIYSPGFPGSYPPNQNCSWNIQVRAGDVIRISLEMIDVSADDCMAIIEKAPKTPRVVQLLNKTTSDIEYTSFGNAIRLQFRTSPLGEQRVQGQGFILRYRAVGHCGHIPTDTHVTSVCPSLGDKFVTIGQRATMRCKDGCVVTVECQKNRQFNVTGPYCTGAGSKSVQVSVVVYVAGTGAAFLLLVSCGVNAFFVCRRKRRCRVVEDPEPPDHDYEEIAELTEMKGFYPTASSSMELRSVENVQDYQVLIPETIANHDYTSLDWNSSLARMDETRASGETEMRNFLPTVARRLPSTESDPDYQLLIPETMESNDYTSLASNSSLARVDETTADNQNNTKHKRRFSRCYDNVAQD